MAAAIEEPPVSPAPSSDEDSKDAPALAKTMKRSNKPLMEKRRRSRINASLNQLKGLVLDAMKKDTSQYSKLEKADILEMTVRHLRTMQRQQLTTAAQSDASVMGKYSVGFTECASEVGRYLSSVDGLSPEVRDRLMYHLAGCIQRTQGMAEPPRPQPANHMAAGMTATHPIHIQIPVATSPSSLPGTSTIPTLLTTSSLGSMGAPSRSPPASQQYLPSQSPPTGLQYSAQSQAPPSGSQYVGAFQVVPNVSSNDLASLMMQGGIMGNVTPLYVSPPQQQQHKPVTVPIQSQVTPPQQHKPTPSFHNSAQYQVPPQRYLVPKDVRDYKPNSPELAHAQQVIKDTLGEERVWRPW